MYTNNVGRQLVNNIEWVKSGYISNILACQYYIRGTIMDLTKEDY